MEEKKDIKAKRIVFTARVPLSIEAQAKKNEYGDIEIKKILNVYAPSLREITDSMDDDDFEMLDNLFDEAD